MSSFVLVDGFIQIAAVNLSSDGRQVTIDHKADLQDDTAFGDAAHSRLGGLKDWSADVEFNQDHAAAHVDATLFPLVGTAVAVEFRPTSGARSTTNPGFTGTGILETYSPVSGAVGETAKARARIMCSNGVPMARQTA